jgi:hypothetical protein
MPMSYTVVMLLRLLWMHNSFSKHVSYYSDVDISMKKHF